MSTCPISDRRCFESLDKCLRDRMNEPNKTLDAKSILLSGDFGRHYRPVIPKASTFNILTSSLPRSYLLCLKIIENVRLKQPGMTDTQKKKIALLYMVVSDQ